MTSVSSSGRAIQPPQAPPPFPSPVLLPARRVAGMVLTAPPEDDANRKAAPAAAMPTTSLERRSSVAGNILRIDVSEDETKSYLLQRKIKNTLFGSVRIGYLLEESDDGLWEVAPSSSNSSSVGPYEMVQVTIEDKSKVLQEDEDHSAHSNTAQDPKTELSALQLVAAHDREGTGHVVGASIIATDHSNIYTITPYHKEGSLFEYCAAAGRLSETDARFFFRQILQGLSTLQSVEICHRDLSLESVHLQGPYCNLVGLTCALRIPTEGDGSTACHLLEAQPPCARNPQYVAPELLKDEPFDGYAVDLWAAGVMLFTMLLGSDALFVAPVQEDRKFKEICNEGGLRLVVARKKGDRGISDNALDLLQSMLRANPKDRPTLAAVLAHPWVVGSGETDHAPPKVPLESSPMMDR